MTYYAFIQNNKINGTGECRQLTEGVINFEITEEINNNIDHYIWDEEDVILDPNYDEKQEQKREAEFNKAFFLTSLGYVRRAVTMADGSKKDFLSDLLPVISMGVQAGTPVNILTYDKPPFDEDVTDWTIYQHQVTVTPQFIQECFAQLANDFLPINEENDEDTTDQSEL